MTRVYLDQTAIIRLGLPNPSPEVQRIRQKIDNREITPVLSTAHWLDTASGPIDEKSRELARFIDGLRPIWIKERLRLYELEVGGFLVGDTFEEMKQRVVCNSVSELVADIGGLIGGGVAVVDSESVVTQMRRSEQLRALFSQSYESNKQANESNKKMFKAGRLTRELERTVQLFMIRKYGKVAAGSADDVRVQAAPSEAFRSLTCEWAATKETWRQNGPLTPSKTRDLQHLVAALPYTDIVVTSDQELRLTMGAVKSQVPFAVALVVRNLRTLENVLERRARRV